MLTQHIALSGISGKPAKQTAQLAIGIVHVLGLCRKLEDRKTERLDRLEG